MKVLEILTAKSSKDKVMQTLYTGLDMYLGSFNSTISALDYLEKVFI